MIGWPVAELWVSSSDTDADIFVYLQDYNPAADKARCLSCEGSVMCVAHSLEFSAYTPWSTLNTFNMLRCTIPACPRQSAGKAMLPCSRRTIPSISLGGALRTLFFCVLLHRVRVLALQLYLTTLQYSSYSAVAELAHSCMCWTQCAFTNLFMQVRHRRSVSGKPSV